MFSRALRILAGPLDRLQLGSLQLEHVFLEVLDHIVAKPSSAGKSGEFPAAYIPAQCFPSPEPTSG